MRDKPSASVLADPLLNFSVISNSCKALALQEFDITLKLTQTPKSAKLTRWAWRSLAHTLPEIAGGL